MASHLISLYPDLLYRQDQPEYSLNSISPLDFMIGVNNTYATMASCNPQAGFVNDRSIDKPMFKYDIVAASLSFLALSLMAFLILTDKRA